MNQNRKHIIVTGCGAAGMFAAIAAASHGARVTVLEKNEKAGKKLYITGKGRCNLTNDCDTADFFDSVVRGGKFLYSAVYGYDAARVRRFFTESGCPLKTERGNRVFPVSDKSSDVIKTLVYEMRRRGVDVRFGTEVKRLLYAEEATGGEGGNTGDAGEYRKSADAPEGHGTAQKHVTGVRLADGEALMCDAVIVATGGMSYPATGSTGDGYRFAEAAGHTVTERVPSLVPFETTEAWHRELQGLTLKNVRLYHTADSTTAGNGKQAAPGRRRNTKQLRFDEQGELLFTHFGVSGPLVLSASAYLPERLPVRFAIDLKPGLTAEELDRRLIRDLEKHAKKQFANSLTDLFPASMIPVMVRLAEAGMPAGGTGNGKSLQNDRESADNHNKAERSGTRNSAGIGGPVRIAPGTPAGEITRVQRRAFGALMKCLPVTVTGTRGFSEAVITRGGVALKEINPSTMESKLCRGLYFAGEVLDCDALTGGFNLQIAWSTGYLAGTSCSGVQ